MNALGISVKESRAGNAAVKAHGRDSFYDNHEYSLDLRPIGVHWHVSTDEECKMLNRKLVLRSVLITGMLFAPGVYASTSPAKMAQRRIGEISTQAAELRSVATQLEGPDMNPLLDWEARFQDLSDAADLINSMGKEIQRLEVERPELSSTEQKAVDVALTILRKDAADATAAIQNADRHKPVLLDGEYRDAVEKLVADSGRLSRAMKDYHRLVVVQSNLKAASNEVATGE